MGKEVHAEITLIREGEQHHLALTISPLRDRRGRLTGRLAVVREITGRVRAEEELARYREHLEKVVAERTAELLASNERLHQEIAEHRRTAQALLESEQKLRRIVEQSNDGLVLTDEEGMIIEWNAGQERITGLRREEVLGRPLWEVQFQVAPTDMAESSRYQQARKDMIEFFKTGQAPWLDQLVETVVQRPDGTRCTIQSMIFSIETERGFMLCGISRDITGRVRVENLIRAQRDLALQLGAAEGLNETLRLCVEAAIHNTDMDAGGVYLISPDSGDLNLVFSMGLGDDFVAATSYYDADSPSARLIREGQPIYIDYQKLDLPLNGVRQSEGLKVVAILPIHHEGRVIACMNIASHSLDEISATTRDTLEMIAAQVGSFIARARAEELLQERERFLQNVFDGIQDGISILDTDLSIVRVNAWMEKMYGQWSSLQGQKCYVVYQQREAPCPWCPSILALETGEAHSSTVPYMTEEGLAGWIALSAFPLKDESGRIRGIIEHVKDITKQVQVEEELRHYTERLEAMREIDQAILAARSPEEVSQAALEHIRRLVPCRRAGITLFDIPAGEATLFAAHTNGETEIGVGTIIPLNFSAFETLLQGEVLIVEDITTSSFPLLQPLVQTLVAEGVRSFVHTPLLAHGELIGTLNVGAADPTVFTGQNMATIREVADQLAIAIHNARLQQEVQRHADELAAAVVRLRELDRLKSEFIQNVSHELRTPLALIRGHAELLNEGDLGELTPQQQRSAEVIARRTRMLSRLVEDITLILEVESREPEQESVPLDDLVRAAVDDFRVKAEEEGLTIRAEIAPNLSPVRGYTIHLRRVLDNLLGNAVKFTPAGGTITVRVSQEDGQMVLRVSDTGIGIPPDQHERIFERFYQVDGSISRKYGGTGLGLALVKEIVEASGGHVYVESEEGMGSTFVIVLPALEPDTSPSP